MNLLRPCYIFILVFLCSYAQAQDTLKQKPSFKGFPVAFYTPETRFGFGAAGICTFHFKKDTIHFPSSISIGAAYTLNKQILAYIPFNMYLKNRLYWLYGEVGYYKYNYYFYGIGNNVPRTFKEYYQARFARIRLSAVRRISKHRFLYTGLKYAFDAIGITTLDSAGMLRNLPITGNKGGNVSGIGWVTNYDTRNHAFYPTKGELVEFFVYHENTYTGSSFKYTRFTLDASYFLPLARKQVLGFNFYGVQILGDAPFTHLGQLGGLKRMRGYYEGRFRDKVALTWQMEWRYMVYKRFGLAAFASTGIVAEKLNQIPLRHFQYAAGSGVRFVLDKKQKINLRADFAFGHHSHGAYFTIAEAF